MANSAWSTLFPASEALFLEPITSDHRPLILTIKSQTFLRRGQMRFDNRLLQDRRVEAVIRFGWNQLHGTNLTDIISHYRKHLARWKRSHCNNYAEQIEVLKSQLEHKFYKPVPDSNRLSTIKPIQMKNDFGNKRAAYFGLKNVIAILNFFMDVLKPGKLEIKSCL